MRILIPAILFAFTLPAMADPVVVDDREWFQPADVTGFSWNEFNAICSPVCSGMPGGTGPDISGYTWASVDDVNALFHYFIGTAADFGPHSHLEVNSTWAPIFINDFVPFSFFGGSLDVVTGWVRTLRDPDFAYIPVLSNFIPVDGEDRARTDPFISVSNSSATRGAWLYRPVSVSVPEPGTLALLSLGLFGMGLTRRRKKV